MKGLLPRARCALVLLVGVGVPTGVGAQQALVVRGPEGAVDSLKVESPRGFAALPVRTLEDLGWDFEVTSDGVLGTGEDMPSVRVQAGNPYVDWDGDLLQLVYSPFVSGQELWVPLQFVVDLMPLVVPDRFQFDISTGTLRVLAAPSGAGGRDGSGAEEAAAAAVGVSAATPSSTAPQTPLPPETRVIIIDPGHGGSDSGTRGPNGVFEKEVALDLGLMLARALASREGYEVHLTRETDELIPIWDRGELATHLKGDRPGIFLSLHANSWPEDRSVRGFETYFLSDARTDHERRVTALENSPIAGGGSEPLDEADPELGFILNELRNLDHSHWSALLAEEVQGELAAVHPGPNRGVKQGPLAVITNALMPGVLIEVGFVSNSTEEALLADPDFRADLAVAVARAVDRFFERYPPGAEPPVVRGGGGA